MPLRIDKYMSSPVVSVYPHDSVAHIRNLMLRHKISRVVVIDSSNKPIGIVSKSDIIRFFLDRRKAKRPLEEVSAREVMSSPVITVPPETTVKQAADMFLKRNISSLPVYSPEKGLIGIITATDLLKAFSDHGRNKARVKDYMRRDYLTAKRSHSIFRIIDLISRDPDGKVIIVEDDKAVGIITEIDIAFVEPRTDWVSGSYVKKRRYSISKDMIARVRDYIVPTAEDIMTPDPITINENEDLGIASDLMYRNRIGCLPAVDSNNVLKGLVTKRSILRAILDIL